MSNKDNVNVKIVLPISQNQIYIKEPLNGCTSKRRADF